MTKGLGGITISKVSQYTLERGLFELKSVRLIFTNWTPASEVVGLKVRVIPYLLMKE